MSPEQDGLLNKAEESIRAARLLYDDALYDFAVSRAYYAMFYVAEALLLVDGLAFSKRAGVISAFGQYLAKPRKVTVEFHRFLIEGQASRNIDDYDTTSRLSREQAHEHIERAVAFLQLGNRMLKPRSE